MPPLEVPKAILSRGSKERRGAQRRKRDKYFLKGPITFDWIVTNVPDPATRVILVARAFMDMAESDECILNAKVWDCAAITDRYQRRRALKRIRDEVGDYQVINRRGRPSVLRRADNAVYSNVE